MIVLPHLFKINLNKNKLTMKRTSFSVPAKSLGLLGLAGLLTFTACTEDPVNPTNKLPAEEVPTTYNFENASYSGQTARIQMLNLLESTAKSANDGTRVTDDELLAIFANTNKDLFGSEKDIASKTNSASVAAIEDYFTSIDTLSGNPDNITGTRLYDQFGVEPAQMIAKGLMGALLYYQSTAVYLGDIKMDVDNLEVTEGKGTKMQHHWDEAFGYFGAPVDYLTNDGSSATDDPKTKTWYWAKYAVKRAGAVDVREEIFTAFLEGRTAINNHRIALLNEDTEAQAAALAARDAAIATIRANWELLAAANVVHYINSSIDDLEANNAGDFYHHWSEGKAFLNTLQHNPSKTITNAELAELNDILGNNPKAAFAEAETKGKLQAANDKLQQIFDFTTPQMSNL